MKLREALGRTHDTNSLYGILVSLIKLFMKIIYKLTNKRKRITIYIYIYTGFSTDGILKMKNGIGNVIQK